MAGFFLLVWGWLLAGQGWAQEVTQPANPAYGDGRILVAAQGLRAVDSSSGQTLWTALHGRHLFEPTLVDGRVYIGSSEGLWALDAATGELLWQAGKGSTLFSPLRVGGRLYSGSAEGLVWAITAADGALLWRRQLSGWVYTPAWVEGRLVTGGRAQRLWALDPADGQTHWSVSLDQELVYRPVAARDGLVVTTFAGSVGHYDASGRLRWRMNDGVVSLSPVVINDQVLTLALDGSLRVRHLDDGHLRVRRNLQGRIVRPAVVAGERALLVSEAGEAAVFSLGTGDWVARQRLAPGDRALPLAVDGRFVWLGEQGPPVPWSVGTARDDQ